MIPIDSALIFLVVIAAVIFIGSYAKILREYERGVIFRLGRNARALLNPGGTGNGPGLVLLAPFIDRMVKVSMQTVALDVPPQDIISRDNVSLKVSAVIYFRVIDPIKAVIAVQDYLYATSQIAQTTLRSVLGQVELDDLLSARDKINQQLQRIIDEHTEPWGIKVATVEVKQVALHGRDLDAPGLGVLVDDPLELLVDLVARREEVVELDLAEHAPERRLRDLRGRV